MKTYNLGYDACKKRKKKLDRIRTKGFFKNQKPGTFALQTSPNWKGNDLKLLLGSFSYFHEQGIIWKKGTFYIDKYTERFVLPLIHAVNNTMKIFKNMSLEFRFDEHMEQLSDLCPGLASNTFIQKLEITYTGKSSKTNFLALNNLLQTNAPCLQTLVVKARGEDYRWILPGLRDNSSIKTIDFTFCGKRSRDAIISTIVAAIARNPNLESLRMYFDAGQIGDLTAESFKTLLTNSMSLRELNLGSSSGDKVNAECIIQVLKNSRSLKRLDLCNVLHGDLRFTKLFRILPDCPLLEYIRLPKSDSDNPILSEEDLAQVQLLPRLPRLIKLDAPSIPMKHIVELLRCHPEVRMPRGYNFPGARRIHLFHVNSHGRYLLDRPNVPLSIWPLVLEKVNRNKDVKDKASVIYELLHGPAGCGRSIIFWKCLPRLYPSLKSYSIVTCHETSFDVFIRDVKDFEELLEMKQDGIFQNQKQGKFQNRKPGKFKIAPHIKSRYIGSTRDQTMAFLELFSYFHEKGIIWEEGSFNIDENNVGFVRPFIYYVTNITKIFKNMSLDFRCMYYDSYGFSDLCTVLGSLASFATNTFIQELSITCNEVEDDCVGLNYLLQTNAPCLQTLVMRGGTGENYSCFVPGLRDNRTLKRIDFDISCKTIEDATTSAIVAAIARNPNLESLRMHFTNKPNNPGAGADLTSEAFKTLLTNSTSLRELTLGSYHKSAKLNGECVIQGLKNSRSLQRLEVENFLFDDLIFTRLFRILPDYPLLEYIRLDDDEEEDAIFSWEDLVQVKLLPRLPRPIKLDLPKPDYPDSLMSIVELLRCHPEVRITHNCIFPGATDDAKRTEFLHAVNMNYHGRYLLDRPNVPLSIWPLILEKVNRNKHVKDKASIIYEFLNGPAGFGSRASFERRGDQGTGPVQIINESRKRKYKDIEA